MTGKQCRQDFVVNPYCSTEMIFLALQLLSANQVEANLVKPQPTPGQAKLKPKAHEKSFMDNTRKNLQAQHHKRPESNQPSKFRRR